MHLERQLPARYAAVIVDVLNPSLQTAQLGRPIGVERTTKVAHERDVPSWR